MLTKKTLKSLLGDYEVPFHNWKKGELDGLLTEIRKEESVLEHGGREILRIVSVVTMFISHPGNPTRFLFELGYCPPNGKYHEKNRFLSGRRRKGETILECLHRRIKKELGLDFDAYEVNQLGENGGDESGPHDSASGLPTRCILHEVRLQLKRTTAPLFLQEKFSVIGKDEVRRDFCWQAQ